MISDKMTRASNFEMLRMLAMFLVLVLHAGFFAVGKPTADLITSEPLDSFIRIFIESLSIVCVNVFVLISGWFGIKATIKGFCNFLFQCLFFLIGIYAIMICLGYTQFSLKGLLGCLFMLKWNWFIKAYLGLFILSPVLNAFVLSANQKLFKIVLIGFFGFQTIYSWCTGAAEFFLAGFSTMSFIGLYLLARYINLYKPRWALLKKKNDISVYLVCCVLVAIGAFVPPFIIKNNSICFTILAKMFNYVSPFVIIASVYLLLCFSKLKLQSKFVNWCGISCFAVFLVHSNPNIALPYFKRIVVYLYEVYPLPIFYLYILLFLIGIFFMSLLLDKIRLWIWNRVMKNYGKYIE